VKNKIEDLRNHLFATLEDLRDPEKPMELDRAREVANIGKVIVDSARAEIDFLKATGAVVGTGFISLPAAEPKPRQLGAGVAPVDTPLRKCASCRKPTAQDPCHECGEPQQRVKRA
jgi:hypothetical protein